MGAGRRLAAAARARPVPSPPADAAVLGARRRHDRARDPARSWLVHGDPGALSLRQRRQVDRGEFRSAEPQSGAA